MNKEHRIGGVMRRLQFSSVWVVALCLTMSLELSAQEHIQLVVVHSANIVVTKQMGLLQFLAGEPGSFSSSCRLMLVAVAVPNSVSSVLAKRAAVAFSSLWGCLHLKYYSCAAAALQCRCHLCQWEDSPISIV